MSQNPFQSVSVRRPDYSYFDLSHDHKMTLNMGNLVPIFVSETLPGDKFSISSEAMLRMMPMVAPIMHKVDLYIHHFFVPNRLLWSNWESFITGDRAMVPGSEPIPPYMNQANFATTKGSLADYLGLPIATAGVNGTQKINALPFAAYQRIWYEYYRDQNLQDPNFTWDQNPLYPLVDGEQGIFNDVALKTLHKRAWEHDYFTSCLPFAQKGPEVTLPIELTVNFDAPGQVVDYNFGVGRQLLMDVAGGGVGFTGPVFSDGTGLSSDPGVPPPDELNIDPNGTLTVDVSGSTDDVATSTSINDLRAAYALQKWLEKNARGGTRYSESNLVHFGVKSSDARLQRPEYIGGSKSTMAISEVLQTGESGTTPQGNMSGHGISLISGAQSEYFCEEHGWIMSIMSIRPKTAYHQGMPRFFTRRDRLDYYWAEFAFLGEQEVLNKELYFDGTSEDEDVFGYIPRYSEYRYYPSRVSGEFHDTLNYWALHRNFTSRPALSAAFIQCDPSTRIFAVEDPDEHHIIGHVYNSVTARRPLPQYGDPGGLI